MLNLLTANDKKLIEDTKKIMTFLSVLRYSVSDPIERKNAIEKIEKIKKRDIKNIGRKLSKNRVQPYVGELFIHHKESSTGYEPCPIIYQKEKDDKITLKNLATNDATGDYFSYNSCRDPGAPKQIKGRMEH